MSNTHEDLLKEIGTVLRLLLKSRLYMIAINSSRPDRVLSPICNLVDPRWCLDEAEHVKGRDEDLLLSVSHGQRRPPSNSRYGKCSD